MKPTRSKPYLIDSKPSLKLDLRKYQNLLKIQNADVKEKVKNLMILRKIFDETHKTITLSNFSVLYQENQEIISLLAVEK